MTATTPNDPEVLDFIERTAAFYAAGQPAIGIAQMRAAYAEVCRSFYAGRPAGMAVRDERIAGPSGLTIPLRHYRPDRSAPAAAGARAGVHVLYMHGGGFILGDLDSHDDVCAELADGSGLPLTSVDYRLAPEHLYPAAIDDSFSAYRHLLAAGARGIIVAGDSAGANLAAAVSLRARREGVAMPLAQLLIYPCLGARPIGGSYEENAAAPILSTAGCRFYFATYTAREDWDHEPDEDLAPLAARDFTGLPPTWMTSAGFDPLRDDAENYARALAAARVPCVWRNEPQLVHGYLRARHSSRVAGASFAFMTGALAEAARLAS